MSRNFQNKYSCPINIWKDDLLHVNFEKCKLKQQRDPRLLKIKMMDNIQVAKRLEERAPLFIVSENVNRCRFFLEIVWQNVSKLKMEIPAVLFPPICAINLFTWVPWFMYIGITSLFTAVKNGKQPEYPSTVNWSNKLCYSHTL